QAHRDRLRRMVCLRFDTRLRGRLDPSDIVQDTMLDAVRRWNEYATYPNMPIYVWLRLIAGQRLVDQYRRHFGAQLRDISREIATLVGGVPAVTTGQLAAQFVSHLTTPSEVAARAERQQILQTALDQLGGLDREILVLRHFEQMSNGEAA